MDHAAAKVLLQRAATPHERIEAVEVAQNLGMPLCEIEEYLDWIDCLEFDDDEEAESDDEGD